MKIVFPFLLLTLLLIAALILQDLVAPAFFLGQAQLFFIPIVFCFGALVLPLFRALLFAFMTAIIEGLMVTHIDHGHIEIRLGWFIFFFMIWTVLLQWVSHLMDGVRWEIHALGSALCTATFLLGTFLLLAFGRGNFYLTPTTVSLIFIPSGVSLLLAPLCYAVLQFLLPPVKKQSAAPRHYSLS